MITIDIPDSDERQLVLPYVGHANATVTRCYEPAKGADGGTGPSEFEPGEGIPADEGPEGPAR
jgi:hypothetical protein